MNLDKKKHLIVIIINPFIRFISKHINIKYAFIELIELTCLKLKHN